MSDLGVSFTEELISDLKKKKVEDGNLKEEVINLKGNIDIKSEKGKGTEILIYLLLQLFFFYTCPI